MRGKITREDAKRFLDEEEFEDLKMLKEEIELLREGFDLPPEDRRRWEELRNKVARGRQSKLEFEEYKREIEKDVSALRKFRKEHYAKDAKSREEAVDFISSELQTELPLRDLNTEDWSPRIAEEIRDVAKEMAEEWASPLSEKLKHPNAFCYESKAWPFPILRIDFKKTEGIPALVWKFRPYAVITVRVWKEKTKKTFKGWTWTSPSSDSPIVTFTQLLTPPLLEMSSEEEAITPWTLLRGLMNGEFQPEGCEIVEKSEETLAYKCEGYKERISLPSKFVDFLRSLGKEDKAPREALHDHGLIDDLTVEILEKYPQPSPNEASKVGEKDLKYLKTISECENRYFSYKEWGERLGLERSGALRALGRLSDERLVERNKHESGKGVKVSLTERGKATLKKYS